MNKAEDSQLYRIRHSLAHVLAQAVLEIRPAAKLGFGPPVENGFYYDFDLDQPLSPEDLPGLEKRMKKIIKSRQTFEREELNGEEMRKKLAEIGQDFKIEQVNDLDQGGGVLTLYRNGPFWDLCEGPHVDSTNEIPKNCFSLDSLAGAYWKGSEKNKMLQRVYGLAFESKEELQSFKEKRRLAQERDHRKLNVDQHYFVIDEEVGKGLPLWLPNGTIIRDELEKLAKEQEFLDGYDRVSTPHITRENLYHTSGHLPYYAESMFPPMEVDGEKMFLKPMNCPHHHLIYRAQPRSYRDLPLRLAEYGTCYRYEQSGELAGLLRVRGLTMNDAHIYCTAEQVKEEFIRVIQLHLRYYELFSLDNFWMRLSLSESDGAKYVNQPEIWARAEALVIEAMDEVGVPYESVRGEAAFYGPKLDFMVKDALGRQWQLGTIQVDYNLPERFELEYTGADNQKHRPVMIHRAPFGSMERFVSVLIEHCGGNFPLWLAPEQVIILPISEKYHDYANKVMQLLKNSDICGRIDQRSEKTGRKIRDAEVSKTPYMIIVGEKEESEGTVSVRKHGGDDLGSMKIDTLIDSINKEIEEITKFNN